MREKRVLRADERTTIAIDKVVHALIKSYAREKGITIAEAAWVLLGIGIAYEAGFELKRDNK